MLTVKLHDLNRRGQSPASPDNFEARCAGSSCQIARRTGRGHRRVASGEWRVAISFPNVGTVSRPSAHHGSARQPSGILRLERSPTRPMPAPRTARSAIATTRPGPWPPRQTGETTRSASPRWRRLRPRRSRRHTMRVSPGRRWSRTASSLGRWSRESEALSVHTLIQRAFFKASVCRWAFCSVVMKLA